MTHPLLGRKQTAEHVAKRVASIAATRLAHPERAAEHALNQSLARRGNPYYTALAARNLGSRPKILSEEHKAKISASMTGKQNCLGHKPSVEHRKKLAAYWAANREKHNFYVDGNGEQRVGERIMAMSRVEYRLWREAVFERDNWSCQNCGSRGGKIHADHIKPWATHPELRYDVTNGRTLCVPCHKNTDTYGSKARKHKTHGVAP